MTVRASTVLASIILNAGVSVEELACASGISEAAILSPTFLSYEDGLRLWDAAEKLTGDPAVGLHAGSKLALDQLSVLGSMFVHAADLRDALDRLVRLLPLVIRPANAELREDAAGARFVYESPSTARQGVDAMLAAVVKLARECTQRHIVPLRVALQSSTPPSVTPYEAYFGVRPVWGQPASAILFRRDDLSAPMRGADPAMSALLEQHAPSILQADAPPRSSFETRLRRAILLRVAAGEASIGAVARSLGTSRRSLQRRLTEEGTSFSAVREDALYERAQELLAREDQSIDAVASQLGFASRTSFERAFRRWSGTSPASARRAPRSR